MAQLGRPISSATTPPCASRCCALLRVWLPCSDYPCNPHRRHRMVASLSQHIRVVIVDDHAVVRTGLRMLIQSRAGITVVGEAGNGSEAITVVARTQPDIIVLDLDLGGESGLDCFPELRTVASTARVLVLTGVRDPE